MTGSARQGATNRQNLHRTRASFSIAWASAPKKLVYLAPTVAARRQLFPRFRPFPLWILAAGSRCMCRGNRTRADGAPSGPSSPREGPIKPHLSQPPARRLAMRSLCRSPSACHFNNSPSALLQHSSTAAHRHRKSRGDVLFQKCPLKAASIPWPRQLLALQLLSLRHLRACRGSLELSNPITDSRFCLSASATLQLVSRSPPSSHPDPVHASSPHPDTRKKET